MPNRLPKSVRNKKSKETRPPEDHLKENLRFKTACCLLHHGSAWEGVLSLSQAIRSEGFRLEQKSSWSALKNNPMERERLRGEARRHTELADKLQSII